MTDTPTSDTPHAQRIATCGCGEFTVTCRGEPLDVYACSCTSCQRLTGSAYSYCAVFASTSISLLGDRRYWRRVGDSGRWIGRYFCPNCGTTTCFDFEAMNGFVGIPAGCFGEANFAAPKKVYWASRKHDWLVMPHDIESIDTQ